MMDIRQLRYFLAVAEERNFMRAADRLHMSQPPLSVQVKALEEDLGVQLFDRTNRGVVLTQAGEAFYGEVQLVMAQLERARAVARSHTSGDAGRLSIGFVSIADYSILPQTLKSFRAKYPRVELHLSEETTNVQIQELLASRIDVGIGLAPVQEAGIEFRSLFDERLMLAVPTALPESKLKRPSLSVFRNHPFVMFPQPMAPGLFAAVHAYCSSAGFGPEILQYARQMQTIVSLVSTGIGVALIPSSLSQLKRAGVTYLPLKEQSPRIPLGILFRKNDPSQALRNFVTLAGSVTKDWSHMDYGAKRTPRRL